ncbi:MAG: hypothetical protein RLZZ366_2164 [Pseudomonadota bacterium]|jgi:hypothetical protein
MKQCKGDGRSHDRSGRIINLNHVHMDLHPARWIHAAAGIAAASDVVPTILAVVGLVVYVGLLMKNLVVLWPTCRLLRHLNER